MPYMTKQRTRDGVVERQCRQCEGWWPLKRFPADKACFGGKRATCMMCFRPQHNALRSAWRKRKAAA